MVEKEADGLLHTDLVSGRKALVQLVVDGWDDGLKGNTLISVLWSSVLGCLGRLRSCSRYQQDGLDKEENLVNSSTALIYQKAIRTVHLFSFNRIVKGRPSWWLSATLGDTGWDPWSWGSAAVEQLNQCTSYWVCTLRAQESQRTEPTCYSYWSPHAQGPCSATREATAGESSHCTQGAASPLCS